MKLNKTKRQNKKVDCILGTLFRQKVLKLILQKLMQLLKCPCQGQLMNCRDFLLWLIYLGKFIPNLAEYTTPLCNLLEKNVLFELQKPQLDAMENLKTLVTSAPCLKTFDSKLRTRLKN